MVRNGGFTGNFGLSSTDIFALPLTREGGKKGSDEASSGAVRLACLLVGSAALSPSSSFSWSSPPILLAAGARLDFVWKIRPGPFPPPKTRSDCPFEGAFCFGAGSIDNKEEAPAPVFCLFAAGRSSSISSFPSSSLGNAGRPIVIFLGARLVLGGSAEAFGVVVLLGGGKMIDDFDDSLVRPGEGRGLVGCCFSFSLSLSLPYVSSPSMMVVVWCKVKILNTALYGINSMSDFAQSVQLWNQYLMQL